MTKAYAEKAWCCFLVHHVDLRELPSLDEQDALIGKALGAVEFTDATSADSFKVAAVRD